MASLIVINGPQKGDYYPLGHRTNVVGRDEALPIQLLDELVSRKHMQIRFNESRGTYSVVDMKSKHGVFVNERKIQGETELSDGDYIAIGRTCLFFSEKDFDGKESALSHYKKVGERNRPTILD